MEALLSSNPESDTLVGNLKYNLDPTGSYVQQRRQSTTFSNVSSASPQGVKTITISLGSASEWLVGKSCTLAMQINNTDTTNALLPATVGVHNLFSRVQIRLGSTLVEDVQEYGKVCELFSKIAHSPAKRIEEGHIGFGTANVTTNPDKFLDSQHTPKTIAAGASKKIYMKFDLSGLLTQHRWIPLFALSTGVTIQLTLADAADAMCASANGVTYSQSYTLTDIRMLADVISLSSELQDSYNSAMLSGQSLKICTKNFEVIKSYLPADSAGSFSIPISKNYTRLASLFAAFTKAEDTYTGTSKPITDSYFPTANSEDFEYYLQLGSKRVPDHPVRGTSEAWMRLMNGTGLSESLHSTGIDQEAYKSNCFCLVQDMERLASVMASGEDVSTGQTL